MTPMRYLVMACMLCFGGPLRAQDSTAADSASAKKEWPAALVRTAWAMRGDEKLYIWYFHPGAVFTLVGVPVRQKIDGPQLDPKKMKAGHGKWWVERDNQLCYLSYHHGQPDEEPKCDGAEINGRSMTWGVINFEKWRYDQPSMKEAERAARKALTPRP